MKASEIRTLPIEQIREALDAQKGQYRQMKFKHAITPLKSPIDLRNARRDIARLATISREKTIGN